jgi:hypothetical protein
VSKRKTKHIWLRFEVEDTPKALSEFQRAADRLFKARSVEARGQFTEEEVVGMVKAAIEQAAAQAAEAPGQALDGGCSPDVPSAEREDALVIRTPTGAHLVPRYFTPEDINRARLEGASVEIESTNTGMRDIVTIKRLNPYTGSLEITAGFLEDGAADAEDVIP